MARTKKMARDCIQPGFSPKQTLMMARTKKMAQDCIQPSLDWDTATIEVKKDNFDLGLSDVMSMTLGKSTVTSSKNEDRGHGKRKKTNNRLAFDEHLTLDMNDADGEEDVLVALGDVSPGPCSGDKTPIVKQRMTPPLKKQKCYHSKQLELPAASPSSRQIAKPGGCKQKGKAHTCCFENGSVNLEMLGHTLCSLSRELCKINSTLKHIKETQDAVEETVEILLGRSSSRDNENIDDFHLPPNSIIEDFPIASMERFRIVEQKLQDRDFLLQCVTFAASAADKTSESRTVCSLMSKILTLEVAIHFTWKGVQRKDQKMEKSAFMHSNVAKVVIAATRKCWVNAELKKIHLAAATWLAQSQAKLDRMKSKTSHADKTGATLASELGLDCWIIE